MASDLLIVGCKDEEKLRTLFPENTWKAVGYVDSTKIFNNSGIFLQPTGYGEGFPHSLADAIVSGMEVWISDIEYLRYGLGRLGAVKKSIAPGWSRLFVSKDLRRAVSSQSIVAATCEICAKIRTLD
jgi:hypothetical protein